MKLSFGMIFSIILIIIFIAFAFYAIKNFVNIGKEAQISKFANDLQNDIDRAWKSSKSSQQEIYSLPEKINEICFEDNENENLYFRSSEFIMPQRIEHLNYEKMFLEVETFCIENKDGKVTLIIEKEFGEDEVTIKSE